MRNLLFLLGAMLLTFRAVADDVRPPAAFEFVSEFSAAAPFRRPAMPDEILYVSALRLRYTDFSGMKSVTPEIHLSLHTGDRQTVAFWIGDDSPVFDVVQGHVANIRFAQLGGRMLIGVDVLQNDGLHQLLLYEYLPIPDSVTKFTRQPPPSNIAAPVFEEDRVEVRNTTLTSGQKITKTEQYRITGLECRPTAR